MEQDGAAAARRRSYRKGPERRAQIIARAIESFAVQGVGASLRAIGDSTGVSPAAPWYYFATRDDLPPEVYRAHEAGGDAKPTPEEESRCREAFLPGHRLPAMRISSSRVAPAGQRRWSALGRDACSPPAMSQAEPVVSGPVASDPTVSPGRQPGHRREAVCGRAPHGHKPLYPAASAVLAASTTLRIHPRPLGRTKSELHETVGEQFADDQLCGLGSSDVLRRDPRHGPGAANGPLADTDGSDTGVR
ncbi:TetR/AcrR family transcriptional regulator [Streptomyces antimycoticus]|uniref:TetR/AcrR family transcriptional regulator n=1 Tax=Streptomyces antimycoticus TaxID=68175 RepID=UPI00369598D8